MNFRNKKVAILGYGIEGQDAERYLKSKGADIEILDQKFDSNYLENLERFDIIVRSPGVYPYKKELLRIKDKTIITSPLNIFFDEYKGKIIGVTGTKGKGTTSTLIYKILKNAGKNVFLAGNIGKPYLSLLKKSDENTYVVLEMSSFQLIDIVKSPHVAVILNITSDHMDWHKDQKEYINAKINIVSHQDKSDWAVINGDYKIPLAFKDKTKANCILFTKKSLDDDYKKDLILRGEHNLENIAAAVSVSDILKIKEEISLKTVRSFRGLEHRLEFVRKINGIKFYDDSFATGPQPTMAAIKSFTEPQTLILGGSDKGLDYRKLGNLINRTKNVVNIILIGQIKDQIKKHIEKKKNIYDLGTSPMTKIVEKAFRVTAKNGVVVLSPAAASFDMFENYKDRGNQFKKAVKNL